MRDFLNEYYEEAIRIFRVRGGYGRRWKMGLRSAWMRGCVDVDADIRDRLMFLRNSAAFGPKGLVRYRGLK